MARAKRTVAKRAAAREAAGTVGRPHGRPQPAGPPRLRHPRDLRVRHRPAGQRGEVAAGREGPALRRLRPGGRRRALAPRGAHPALAVRHRLRGPRPRPQRKLLVHRNQIDELMGQTQQQALTLVPLSLYFKDGKAKVELALARAGASTTSARPSSPGTPTGRPPAPPGTSNAGGRRTEHPVGGRQAVERRYAWWGCPPGRRQEVPRTKGVNGFDFGRRGGRSEPWSPEPR